MRSRQVQDPQQLSLDWRYDGPEREANSLHETIPDARALEVLEKLGEAEEQPADEGNAVGVKVRVVEAAQMPRHPIRLLWRAVPRLGPSPAGLEFMRWQLQYGGEDNEDLANYLVGDLSAAGLRAESTFATLPRVEETKRFSTNRSTLRTHRSRLAMCLQATALLEAARVGEVDELERLLLRYSLRGWRSGPIALVVAQRQEIEQLAPPFAGALSDAADLVAGWALNTLTETIRRADSIRLQMEAFLIVYQQLRLAALFHPRPAALRERIRSALVSVPSNEAAGEWLSRALKRPLHLLKSSEEWSAFIDELLDLADDPMGRGAVFAAYEGSYYRNVLNPMVWEHLRDPLSWDFPWERKTARAVIEQTDRNLNERWYFQPHHAAINMLRVVVYLRAEPEMSLSVRDKNALRHLARRSIVLCADLTHRKGEVLKWARRLEGFANGAAGKL